MLLLRAEGCKAGEWLWQDLLLLMTMYPDMLVQVVASREPFRAVLIGASKGWKNPKKEKTNAISLLQTTKHTSNHFSASNWACPGPLSRPFLRLFDLIFLGRLHDVRVCKKKKKKKKGTGKGKGKLTFLQCVHRAYMALQVFRTLKLLATSINQAGKHPCGAIGTQRRTTCA
jgi:hypothetical protein